MEARTVVGREDEGPLCDTGSELLNSGRSSGVCFAHIKPLFLPNDIISTPVVRADSSSW